MLVIVIGFVLFLLIGVPIAYVLGFTTIVYMFSVDNLSLMASAPQRIFSGVQNFGLLAIPLFILVGELMNRGGLTTRLVTFANHIVGHFRGGLAYVNVIANVFLASIIGSANAQAAMMSKVMVPEMEKSGYKKEFSAALTVSSALLGPIIPPSLWFIIYGVTAEVSIARMFIAGILPGVLLGTGFIILIYIIGIKQNFPKESRSSISKMIQSFLSILPALSIPILIIVGILSGVFTATESAAAATFFVFLIGMFIYKELKLKDIPNILFNTAINTSIVTFIVAMATLFGWIISYERMPQQIANVIISISDNPMIFLLLCILLLLVVGMFIDGIAAIIIIVPVLLPVATMYGIDPVRFGVIVTITLVMGIITPPVGTALFITSSITKVSIESLSYALLPFYLVSFIILIIITLVPGITLWLPSFMN